MDPIVIYIPKAKTPRELFIDDAILACRECNVCPEKVTRIPIFADLVLAFEKGEMSREAFKHALGNLLIFNPSIKWGD